MKHGLVLSALGILLSVVAYPNPVLRIPAIWLGACFVALGGAHFLRTPNLFGKKQDGTLPWLQKLLLMPYFGVNYCIWNVHRVLSKEPPLHQVVDSFWIGRRHLSKEYSLYAERIVDLTSEFEEPISLRRSNGYRLLPILDAGTPEVDDLLELHRFTEGKSLFIHCAQGHGRTGLVAAILLYLRGDFASPETALRHIQLVRPGVRLNEQQLRFIDTFPRSKKGKKGKKHAAKPVVEEISELPVRIAEAS